MIRAILALLSISLCSEVALASGWNDFELKIDDNYWICRANSLQIGLWENQYSCIYHPQDLPETGPILSYVVTPTHILLKTAARKRRNLFPGDEFEDVDLAREFYFVVEKSSNQLSSPLTRAEFEQHAYVHTLDIVSWKPVRNPNVVIPLMGMILMVFYLLGPFGIAFVALGGAFAFLIARFRWQKRVHRLRNTNGG